MANDVIKRFREMVSANGAMMCFPAELEPTEVVPVEDAEAFLLQEIAAARADEREKIKNAFKEVSEVIQGEDERTTAKLAFATALQIASQPQPPL